VLLYIQAQATRSEGCLFQCVGGAGVLSTLVFEIYFFPFLVLGLINIYDYTFLTWFRGGYYQVLTCDGEI